MNNSECMLRDELPPTPPELKGRRSFLGALLGVGTAFVASLLSVPLTRFALFPVLRTTTEKKMSPVGAMSDFSSISEPVMRKIQIEQVDGWRKTVSEKAVYITKDSSGKLSVLSSVCPHLGCTVPWNQGKNAFFCPCHGGTYAPDGTRIAGPALRGMDTLPTSVQDGQLLVEFQFFRQLVAHKEVIG